jgi:hypothetical protein
MPPVPRRSPLPSLEGSAAGKPPSDRASRACAAVYGCGHQALSSSLPALPRSFLTCAAWSFLRDRLTPAPCDGQESLSVLRSQKPCGNQEALFWATKGSRIAVIFSCWLRGSSRATSKSFSSLPFGPLRLEADAVRPTIRSADTSKMSANFAICSEWSATGLRSQNA